MKKLAIILTVILSGCFDDTNDLKEHIATVQANTKTYIKPIEAVPVFNHFSYDAESLRSPFDLPKPEAIQEKMQQMTGCLSPDPRRRKQPLEKYAISDLTMRGTLGELGVIWALVEASDTSLHRVAIGNYLGLFNGKIIGVDGKNVKVIELIPDGSGCWAERETNIAITESNSEGQGN
jgi:type IV pilus assembly protein PilP